MCGRPQFYAGKMACVIATPSFTLLSLLIFVKAPSMRKRLLFCFCSGNLGSFSFGSSSSVRNLAHNRQVATNCDDQQNGNDGQRVCVEYLGCEGCSSNAGNTIVQLWQCLRHASQLLPQLQIAGVAIKSVSQQSDIHIDTDTDIDTVVVAVADTDTSCAIAEDTMKTTTKLITRYIYSDTHTSLCVCVFVCLCVSICVGTILANNLPVQTKCAASKSSMKKSRNTLLE